MCPASLRLSSSRGWVVLLSAGAVTLLFSLPRLLLLQVPELTARLNLSWTEFLFRSLYLFLVALLILVVNLEYPRLRLPFLPAGRHLLAGQLLMNLLLFIGINSLFYRLHLYLFEPPYPERLFGFLFTITAVLEVLLGVLLSFVFRLTFHSQEMRLANERLKNTTIEAQYEVLKSQVNPHFLFNSLNTVHALIQQDPAAAMRFVGNLSDVYRYTLTSRSTDLVFLEEELQFLEAYLAMLRDRYGEKIRFSVQVQPAWLRRRLPPVSLQLLVENAVKHNRFSSRKPLDLFLAAGPGLSITLSNSLQLKKESQPSTGLGLSSLNQRCAYLSGRGIIIQRSELLFSVTLPLLP